MKKILTLIIIFFLLVSPVFSSEFNFDRAYQDYLFASEKYREAYREYIKARDSYLKYQTLASKTKAFEETFSFLQWRNEVIRTYLLALRLKLEETENSTYKQFFSSKIEEEINWYLNHKNTLKNAPNLENLIILGKETETKYLETECLIYQILGIIITTKEKTIHQKITTQSENLRKIIEKIKQSENKEINFAEKGLEEVKNLLLQSSTKQEEAEKIILQMEPGKEKNLYKYQEIQTLLEESHQILKKANSYLKEIISEVKNEE